MPVVHRKTIYKYVKYFKVHRFHFRQKENTQKTHSEEKLDKIDVMLGIFQRKTGTIGVTLETFPRKLFQLDNRWVHLYFNH